MLKLIASLILMYATVLSATSNEALMRVKTSINAEQLYASLLRSPHVRSDESELLKILGKWEVSTGQLDAEMTNYLNITYVGMGDSYYEAFGTDGLIDYASGDPLECLYDLNPEYSQKYVCVSMIYEGMYNWYFFNLVNSSTIEGVYVFSSVDDIDENYAWTTSELHGKISGTSTTTPSEDIISSNLNTLKSKLESTKTYSVSGSFAGYDFAGVDAAFDWAFVTPDGTVYQLQGIAPSAKDVFGWKKVYVNPNEPSWYMSYLGDWDNDGNGKYDWILVGNGFDAVYKLEGVTATGNFAYSSKIDVPYSVSSDKKTITFGASSNEIPSSIDIDGSYQDIQKSQLVGDAFVQTGASLLQAILAVNTFAFTDNSKTSYAEYLQRSQTAIKALDILENNANDTAFYSAPLRYATYYSTRADINDATYGDIYATATNPSDTDPIGTIMKKYALDAGRARAVVKQAVNSINADKYNSAGKAALNLELVAGVVDGTTNLVYTTGGIVIAAGALTASSPLLATGAFVAGTAVTGAYAAFKFTKSLGELVTGGEIKFTGKGKVLVDGLSNANEVLSVVSLKDGGKGAAVYIGGKLSEIVVNKTLTIGANTIDLSGGAVTQGWLTDRRIEAASFPTTMTGSFIDPNGQERVVLELPDDVSVVLGHLSEGSLVIGLTPDDLPKYIDLYIGTITSANPTLETFLCFQDGAEDGAFVDLNGNLVGEGVTGSISNGELTLSMSGMTFSGTTSQGTWHDGGTCTGTYSGHYASLSEIRNYKLNCESDAECRSSQWFSDLVDLIAYKEAY